MLKLLQEYEDSGASKLPTKLNAETMNQAKNLIEKLEQKIISKTEHETQLPAKIDLGPNSIGLRFPGGVYCQYLARDFSIIHDLVCSPDIVDSIKSVTKSRSAYFWYDEMYIRWPDSGDNQTPWHHDIAALPIKGSQVSSVWFALCDIEIGQSNFQTIEQSHLQQQVMYRPPTGRENKTLLPGHTELPDFEQLIASGKVKKNQWTMKAGEGVIFHPYCVHGTTANHTNKKRISLATRWVGDDGRWSPNEYSIIEPLAGQYIDEQSKNPRGLLDALR